MPWWTKFVKKVSALGYNIISNNSNCARFFQNLNTSGLLSSVLASRWKENPCCLAHEGARRPQLTSAVPEGLHLSSSSACKWCTCLANINVHVDSLNAANYTKSCRDSNDNSIEFRNFCGGRNGDIRVFGRSVHFLQNLRCIVMLNYKTNFLYINSSIFWPGSVSGTWKMVALTPAASTPALTLWAKVLIWPYML